ncbi:MAG: class I SAM-dependent methyltransferase [Elusimicrobia bacterium]|nr:class I SAM-dependent methyltransferase [Elusimicrobiota bacterium]
MALPPDISLETVPCPLCGKEGARAQAVARGKDYEYATTEIEFEFVACPGCGLVYLNPRPRVEALARIYPADYYPFVGDDEGSGPVRILRARWESRKVMDYARLLGPGPRKVLDVGCGRGRLLRLLRQAGGPDWELHGIELDAQAVAAARDAGFEAVRTTLEDYRPAARFDLIVLQQVIEHVARPPEVMRRLFEMTAPGGAVVLETPDLAGWDYRLFRGGLWGGYHFPRHWALFTGPLLRRLANDAGFEVVEQKALMSLSFWSWSIHNALLTAGVPKGILRAIRPPSVPLLALSFPLEALQSILGLPSSNQRLIARRKA